MDKQFVVLYKLSGHSWNFKIDSAGQRQIFSKSEAEERRAAFEGAGFPAVIAQILDGQKLVKSGGERDG